MNFFDLKSDDQDVLNFCLPQLIKGDRESILDYQIEKGLLKEPVHIVFEGEKDIFNPDIQYINGQTALHRACHEKCLPIIKSLLKEGANPDIQEKQDGWTSLHLMSWFNQVKIAEILLEAGANPNIQENIGMTALNIACARDYPEMMKLLVKYGAKMKFFTGM